MKMLKVMFGATLALVLAFAPVVSYAEAENSRPINGGNFGGLHDNLDFYGVKQCRVNRSTTAVLCKSGEGFLDAVCSSGGTGGAGYSLAVDSGIAASTTLANSEALVLTPIVFALADTTAAQGQQNCWSAKTSAGGPVKFVNGLVGIQSGATHTTIVYWHYSGGQNP